MSDAQTPTSVQEARERVDREAQYLGIEFISTAEENAQVERYEKALDALIAAVRAERDAEIRGMVEGLRQAVSDEYACGTCDPHEQIENGVVDAVLALLSDREAR